MANPNINKRNTLTNVDAHSVEAMTYNEPAGSRKVSEVGRSLLPIPKSGATPPFTTNCTVATPLPTYGLNFAVYNNSGAVVSVNFSQVSSPALAPGATDANGSVGIPCAPNAWTYVAAGSNNWIIANSANALVFMIEDVTSIQQVSARNAST